MQSSVFRVTIAAIAVAGLWPGAPVAALGDAATKFNLYLPPNNNGGREPLLIITNVSSMVTTIDVIDDGEDGDEDDTVVGQALSSGQSLVVAIHEGAVNDDRGGKADGDYLKVTADHPVVVQMATRSNWQHDWASSEGKSGIGRSFFLYGPATSGADNDVNVFAYSDDTRVTITDVTSTPTTSQGPTQIDLAGGRSVLDVTIQQGEDLIVRENGLGLDIIDPGHTYWVRSSKPVTVQYGHLGQISGGNQARDGAGFVPSSNGSAVGSLYYFSIPHNPGLEREKELRVACFTDGSRVRLAGATADSEAWVEIADEVVDAGGHLDFVGQDNAEFRDVDLYRLTVEPAHHRCTVFEGNWMETGAYGTSDFASSLSGSSGSNLGHEFVAYVGPPGLQHRIVQAPSGELTNDTNPSGGYAAHLYVYAQGDSTWVTVTDVDGDGAVLDETFQVPADRYYDLVIDSARYNAMRTAGRRPYVRVLASQAVMVMSGNFNDNWMAFFSSVMPPEPEFSITTTQTTLTCGEQTTLEISCVGETGVTLSDTAIHMHLPDGLVPVAGDAWTTGADGISWGLGDLTDAPQTINVVLQNDCTMGSCRGGQLSSVTAECAGSAAGSIYANVQTQPLALLDAESMTVIDLHAQDTPDYQGSPPSPHVALSAEVVGPIGGLVEVLRAVNDGDPDASQTLIGQLSTSGGVEPLAVQDSYAQHYEETRFYRLRLTDASGCSQLVGPVAVRTSSGASGGEDSGLESNGRLSDRLAKRAVARARGSARFATGVGVLAPALQQTSELSSWLPDVGPSDTSPVNASPGDLPLLTNAREVFAVDYLDAAGRAQASALLVNTRGEVYEHQKALCDRARGARIDHVGIAVEPNGSVMRMALTDAARASGEYAVEVKLYAREDGSYDLHSAWLRGSYPDPTPAQEVINLQVWSPKPGFELSLLSDILATHRVRWSDSQPAPPVRIARAVALGGHVTLELAGDVETLDNHGLRVTRITEHGASVQETISISSDTQVVLEFPPFLDVTVDLLDHEHGVVDSVWVSDGAWTAVDDRIGGGGSRIDDSSFLCPEGTREPADARAIELSGCAWASANVDRWVSLVRHLGGGAAPLHVDDISSLSADLDATGPTRVCLEDTDNDQLACAVIPTTAAGGRVDLDIGRLVSASACGEHAVTAVRLISFSLVEPGPGELSVSRLRLLRSAGNAPAHTLTDTPLAYEPCAFEPAAPLLPQARPVMQCSLGNPPSTRLGGFGVWALGLLLAGRRLIRLRSRGKR